MYRIIDGQSTGKTRQLMEFAKEKKALFVCENPYAASQKALGYGLVGIETIGYYDFWYDYIVNDERTEEVPYFVIDELENYLRYGFLGAAQPKMLGYTLTVEEYEYEV